MANRLNRFFLLLRSLFYTGNFNIENMQGTGFRWLVDYVGKKGHYDISDELIKKEGEYFNTHPFFITFILGVWFKELNTEEGPDYWKKVYSSAFAAVGDSFFWHSFKVFCFLVMAIIGVYSPVAGLIVYLVLYNGFHFYLLFEGFKIGFKYGKNLITWFNLFRVNQWGQIFDAISVFLLGLLLSFLIKSEGIVTYWHYFLGASLLLLGLFFGKILNVTLTFILAIFGFGVLLLLRGL